MQGGSWRSYGLNCALAGKGVLVQDEAFLNLKPSELFMKGATVAGRFINVHFLMLHFIATLYFFCLLYLFFPF